MSNKITVSIKSNFDDEISISDTKKITVRKYLTEEYYVADENELRGVLSSVFDVKFSMTEDDEKNIKDSLLKICTIKDTDEIIERQKNAYAFVNDVIKAYKNEYESQQTLKGIEDNFYIHFKIPSVIISDADLTITTSI